MGRFSKRSILVASTMALVVSAEANNFHGNLIEARGGISIPFGKNQVVGTVGKSSFATTGPLGMLGLRYIYNRADAVASNVDLGVSLGADRMFGKTSSTFSSILINPSYYSVTQKERYELALRMGSTQGGFYPFVKAGVVAGNWKVRATTNYGNVNKTDLLWGATAGLGSDYAVHEKGSLGFIAEIDWYGRKNYTMESSAGTPPNHTLQIKPWTANLAITYKVKLGKIS